MNIVNSLVRTAKTVGRALKNAAPEIAVVGGTIGLVTAAVIACKETPKAMKVVEEHQEKVETVEQALENGVTSAGEDYTEEDAKHDKTMIFVQDGLQLVKVYAPAVILATVSIVSIFAGGRIFRKRITALTGAYALLEQNFSKYRNGVIDKFGKDIDRELRYGIKKELHEKAETDENGNTKTEVEEVETTNYDGYSDYARFFDESSPYWQKNGGMNLSFLVAQQSFATDKLKRDGVLFLNDVYTMLGIPRTAQGQQVGWVYDPDRTDIDSYVDFGISEVMRNKKRYQEFVRDYERSLLLDFNCDGSILNKFVKYDRI